MEHGKEAKDDSVGQHGYEWFVHNLDTNYKQNTNNNSVLYDILKSTLKFDKRKIEG